MSRLEFKRVKRFSGGYECPPDKSLTHRAYLFAALAKGSGSSVIYRPLKGEDCESTRHCLEALGAVFTDRPDGSVEVGAEGDLRASGVELDCGNSGTTMRLLSGIVAGIPCVDVTLVGDSSLSRRPMGRIAEPLRLMGAQIDGDTAPLSIRGTQLRGIYYTSPVASAQIKSCVLLAGCHAEGETWVSEPALSRDHTERMLTGLGVDLLRDGDKVGVRGGASWKPFEFSVPGDISSAAFFLIAAAMVPGSDVVVRGVGINPSRSGVLDVLHHSGAVVEIVNERDEAGEPVGDVRVVGSEQLSPFQIEGSLVPRLIDEIPALAVLATQAHGTSVIRDAAELRVKETDRIAVVSEALNRMGARVEATDDGMIIHGPTPLTGTTIDAAGDHRIGMAFAVAGSVANGITTIENADSIQTSYPEFKEHYNQLAQF